MRVAARIADSRARRRTAVEPRRPDSPGSCLEPDPEVRDDVAMTGEITLTGEVLPIGGLKEKALGAQDLGYKLVIAPARNAADLEDFPESLREGMEFYFVERIGEVLDLALRPARAPAAKRG